MAYTTPGDESRRDISGAKPFQAAIGREFEGVEEVEARTRAYLAKLIASATAVATLFAGGYGLVAGNLYASHRSVERCRPNRRGRRDLLLRAAEEWHIMNAPVTVASDAARAEPRPRSRDAAKVQKSRVQLDFAPRSMERLNALKLKTEASSYAEVVKNALRLYEALIEEAESGKQFLTRDKDGTVAPLRLFL